MTAVRAQTDAATGPLPARFALVSELGRGGMGVVYEVRDDRGNTVALKGLKDLRPREILRIKDEFRAVRDLRHPNLVRLGELFEDDGRWYFTMELVRGVDFLRWVRPHELRAATQPATHSTAPGTQVGARADGGSERSTATRRDRPRPASAPATRTSADLETGRTVVERPGPPRPLTPRARVRESEPHLGLARIERDAGDGGPPVPTTPAAPHFDEARLRGSLRGLADALGALHRAGLVHRDIKPSNLRVDGDGRLVLLDFGAVAAIDRRDDEIVGTLAYMAPEQATGQVSSAVDWYAVGIMLYRALTGHLPFAGSREGLRHRQRHDAISPDRLVRDLPRDLVRLCERLLDRDPLRRAGEPEVRAVIGDEPSGSHAPASGGDGPWWRISSASLPFVGRTAELERLDHVALPSAMAARCVVVTGPSGIGKTAVVHQFLRKRAAASPEVVILHGRCDARELVPYNALDGVVDDLARLLGREQTLLDELPADAGELVRLFPVLSSALSDVDPDIEPPGSGAIATDIDRSRATIALGQVLTAIAALRPVLIVLDDLHWADADSIALLSDLLSGNAPPPVLVVATARGSAAACPALRGLRLAIDEIALGGLDDSDVRRLVDAVGGADPASDAERIARGANGHPMFVTELARFAAEHRSAAGSLDEALWDRAAALALPARRLLGAIVAAGAQIALDVAASAAEINGGDVAASLGELRAGRLVRTTRRDDHLVVEPYHDRVAEAVLSRLPGGERAGLHGRLAMALAVSGAPPEPLAFHLAAAGHGAEAAVHAERAAQRAAAAFAFDRAAHWYAMVLELGNPDVDRRRSLQSARGDMLVRAGRPRDAALAFLEAAAGEGLTPIEATDLRRRAFEQYLVGGFLAEGLAIGDEVLAELDLALPRSRGRVIGRMVWHHLRNDLAPLRWKLRTADQVPPAELVRLDACFSAAAGFSLVDSLRGAAYAIQLPRMSMAVGEPFRIARALASASFTAAAFHQPRRLARLEAAIARIRTEGDFPDVRTYEAIAAVARAFFFDNDWPASIRLAEEALADRRATGGALGWESDMLDMFVAWSLQVTGEVDRCSRHVQDVVRSAQRTGNRFREIGFRCQFPQPFLHVDDPAGARADVDEAFASWQCPDELDPVGNLFMWTTKARSGIALYADDIEAQFEPLMEGWHRVRRSLLARIPTVAREAEIWRAHLRLALAARRPDRAPALLAETARDVRALGAGGMPVAPHHAALIEAAIAHRRGDHDTAAEKLSHLIPHFARRGMMGWMHAARWRLGRLIGGERGAALCAQADRGMNDAGIVRPEAMRRVWAPGWDE